MLSYDEWSSNEISAEVAQSSHPYSCHITRQSNCLLLLQEMVRWFLSAHQSAIELTHSLHTQVESYKTHTNALKAELNAACRRQLTSMAASLDYQVH